MQDSSHQIEIARRFAEALDHCDYEAAGEFLTADCRYYVDSDVRTGPDAILDSYRDSDIRARNEFDDVCYTSAVAADASDRVRIRFSDELSRKGQTHTFRCEQLVHFNANQKIDHIELHELPGERDLLNDFRKSLKVSSEA